MSFNIVDKLLGITLLGTAWVLWLLVGLSVVSVTVMLERALFFSRMRINFPDFTNQLAKLLIDRDAEGIKRLCANRGAIEAQVVLRGMDYSERGATAMRESMEGFLIGNRQILDRGLVVLGTLGNNAPFIGLFGTVIGIIMSFKDLSDNPAGGPSVVMAGISESLVATAVGLMVAIPAVIAFNAFNRIVKRRLANAEAVMKMVLSSYERG
ncbi:MAG: MotA/TolQ/ExbB proton channel family protein [Proteobacteria bacterium]|nr:MotA/TolQ/ExbB proton channel family protein [Pseudomonadota bacterium]